MKDDVIQVALEMGFSEVVIDAHGQRLALPKTGWIQGSRTCAAIGPQPEAADKPSLIAGLPGMRFVPTKLPSVLVE